MDQGTEKYPKGSRTLQDPKCALNLRALLIGRYKYRQVCSPASPFHVMFYRYYRKLNHCLSSAKIHACFQGGSGGTPEMALLLEGGWYDLLGLLPIEVRTSKSDLEVFGWTKGEVWSLVLHLMGMCWTQWEIGLRLQSRWLLRAIPSTPVGPKVLLLGFSPYPFSQDPFGESPQIPYFTILHTSSGFWRNSNLSPNQYITKLANG